jgi:hypothetical protein
MRIRITSEKHEYWNYSDRDTKERLKELRDQNYFGNKLLIYSELDMYVGRSDEDCITYAYIEVDTLDEAIEYLTRLPCCNGSVTIYSKEEDYEEDEIDTYKWNIVVNDGGI